MGVSLYYGYYSPECNNEKVLPYLVKDTNDVYTNFQHYNDEIYVDKENQKEFFDHLRKYSTEYDKPHCFVITSINDLYSFLCDVKDICNWVPDGWSDDSIPDLVTYCIIIWVM